MAEVFGPDGRHDRLGVLRQILKVLAWFVASGGDCRNKWEKKSGNILEIKINLRNFTSSKPRLSE